MTPRALLLLPILLLSLPSTGCGPAPVLPEQLFKTSVLPRLLAGDEAGYLKELAELCKKSPSFKTNFAEALQVYLPEARLTNEPRLHIISPAGVMTHIEAEHQNGALRIRWFDERKPPRDPKRLSARLFAGKLFPGDPQHPREKGEFLAENMLLGTQVEPDGTNVTTFTTRYLPPPWLYLELRDPDNPPDKQVEDTTWFSFSYALGDLRLQVARSRDALRALAERGGLSDAERDLLLARLLASAEYLRPAAQLLEFLHKDGRRSPGSEALLKAVYAALGRGPAVPPEAPIRDDIADWDKKIY